MHNPLNSLLLACDPTLCRTLQQVLLVLHAVLAFSFILAFAIPLAIAGTEERSKRQEETKERVNGFDLFGFAVDFWLLIKDSIPVFLLFSMFRDAPEDASAARMKWREESSIRVCFWIALVLGLTLPFHFLFK